MSTTFPHVVALAVALGFAACVPGSETAGGPDAPAEGDDSAVDGNADAGAGDDVDAAADADADLSADLSAEAPRDESGVGEADLSAEADAEAEVEADAGGDVVRDDFGPEDARRDESGAEDAASGCPWGGEVPSVPAVGLAAVEHLDEGTADETAVFERMNEVRGGEPLAWNACLADLARSHSRDMVDRGYFGHGAAGSPGSFMVADRAAAAGLSADGWLNEDILQGDLRYWLGGDIARTVDMWMTDDHRLPILGCREVGVGVVSVPYLDTVIVYVTADFVCD